MAAKTMDAVERPSVAHLKTVELDEFLHRRRRENGADDVVPFLKWAGGKRWLLPLALRLRSVQFDRYIEPFLGSGAMFFGVRPSGVAFLSDCNADLIETYAEIKQNWEKILLMLSRHHKKHCESYYYDLRAKSPKSPAARAARFIYLNRTCWNGLYRVNKRGEFNVPIGTKSNVLLDNDRFDLIAKTLKRAELKVADFEEQIDRARKGDLVFADPPYTVRHKYNGFIKYNENLFSWDDQVRLCEALIRAKARGAQVVCTNADHESIRKLYGKAFSGTPVSRYSAIAGAGGTRGSYAELIFMG